MGVGFICILFIQANVIKKKIKKIMSGIVENKESNYNCKLPDVGLIGGLQGVYHSHPYEQKRPHRGCYV